MPGRSKTRLSPPCTPEQAAELAEAALVDTLSAVEQTPCDGHTLVLEGPRGDWLPDCFEVVPQRGRGLGERLAAAFSGRDEPTLLIGMDTPQVTPELLGDALAQLESSDALLGPAADGGYWAIGMRAPQPAAFDGVPMSSSQTGASQRDRLQQLGLAVSELPTLRDIDDIDDARRVAAERPHGGFARALEAMEPVLV
jgi:rSAM/selenodomain-associated transferase 1